MAPTSMHVHPLVRKALRSTFRFKEYDIGAKMAAPPVAKNSTAVGMAFDYLSRFWLKRRHSDAEERPWLAELAFRRLEGAGGGRPNVNAARKASVALATAKSEYAAYMATGIPTGGLMRAVLGLATLDPAYYQGLMEPGRVARVTARVGTKPRKSDVLDLRALWKVMEGGDLKGLRTPMRLNPDFGSASTLVGGADADVIADGLLVEIKTAKSPAFQRKYFDQLAGYAVLQRLAGRPDFRGMGVYFSRHGHLERVDVDCIYGAPGLGSLLAEFPRIAERAFGDWREMQFGRA